MISDEDYTDMISDSYPEQLVDVITQILDKVHVTHFGQQQVLGLLRERNLW